MNGGNKTAIRCSCSGFTIPQLPCGTANTAVTARRSTKNSRHIESRILFLSIKIQIRLGSRRTFNLNALKLYGIHFFFIITIKLYLLYRVIVSFNAIEKCEPIEREPAEGWLAQNLIFSLSECESEYLMNNTQ